MILVQMFWKELPFISAVRHLEIITFDPVMFHSSNLSVGFLDSAKKQKPLLVQMLLYWGGQYSLFIAGSALCQLCFWSDVHTA